MGDYRKINPRDPKDDEFSDDLAGASASFPQFVFIEPDYGDFLNDFRGGNSQHPLDGCAPGERLIKYVYEHLRSSPIWERSLLIVTYDEHGGFYDHVIPPEAFPPGSDDRHRDIQEDVNFGDFAPAKYGGITLTPDELNPNKFDFARLGVRVPAVVVSPLIPKGTVSNETYDHTTITRTYCDLFGLGFLTQRDRMAKSLRGLFTAGGVRQTPATLRDVNTA
jgi:phospholipase C